MSVIETKTISCSDVTIGDNGCGECANKHSCVMVQALLIDAINDPNYFIKRIKDIIEGWNPKTQI